MVIQMLLGAGYDDSIVHEGQRFVYLLMIFVSTALVSTLIGLIAGRVLIYLSHTMSLCVC